MINTQKSVISWTCDQEVSVLDRSLASVCSLWSYPVRVVPQPANKTVKSALSILISLRGPRRKNEIGRGVSEQGSLRNRRKFSWTCEQEAPILERTLRTCVLCLEFSGLCCPSSSKTPEARREIPFSSKTGPKATSLSFLWHQKIELVWIYSRGTTCETDEYGILSGELIHSRLSMDITSCQWFL